jgi:hypothetical protein
MHLNQIVIARLSRALRVSQSRGNLLLRRKDFFEDGCVKALGDSHVVVTPLTQRRQARYDVQGFGLDALFNE